jgi:demethylspheroidene O-methyltransferase
MTLRERLKTLRDRLLASGRFRAFAVANPLTRGAARRDARAMLDLCAGFVYSQVLFACVRLNVFEALRSGPLPLDALAQRLHLPRESASRLLDAAASLRLAEKRGDGYGLGRLGAALIDNPHALSLIEHQPLLYADLADPIALLRAPQRGASLARYWPYLAGDNPQALGADAVAPYSALMAASQPLLACEILDAYPMANHRRLMDVGGGEGVFLCKAGKRAPHLALTLFDLPAVAARARDRVAKAGLAERIEIHGGSFLHDALPEGADLVTLIRIVHDHDDASALKLLRAIRAALAPGGTLLIAEAMSGVKGAEPLDAYYGFYTLAMGRGEPRTFEEIAALLREAGYARVERRRNNLPTLLSVVVGQRP